MEDWQTEMTELEELRNLAAELTEYADYINDEVGETCRLLIDLSGYTSYLDDAFVKSLRKEIEDNLTACKKYYTWVEKPVTTTRVERSLEYNG